MRNLETRTRRLEESLMARKQHILVVSPGETPEAKEAQFRAEHPEAKEDKLLIIICHVSEPQVEERSDAPADQN
jgi:hypothetical protein